MSEKPSSKSTDAIELTFRPVTKSRLSDFEALFESKGAPSYCWCMAFREMGPDRAKSTNAERKAAMAARINKNLPVGLLGYDGKDPVAWVSIAPRQAFLDLGGPEAEAGERIWSLTCMFLKRSRRGQGIGHQMIAAAIALAKKRKATVLEAYPVDPASPSYRFMGFVPAFRKAGFSPAGQSGTRRHVMRLPLCAEAGT